MKNELECWSKRTCIHVAFFVIQYIQSYKTRWWTSPPQMNLSPRTRVYIQGGRWVSNWSGFWPVWSGTALQTPIKRSLDLFRLMWWISYLGLRYDTVACQPSAWICHLSNLWEDLEDPGGACLSPLYTSDWLFRESRLLAIIGLPWPMTVLQKATHYWIAGKGEEEELQNLCYGMSNLQGTYLQRMLERVVW